mmetsp:Transcript_10599/g.21177  ORF Transcript_10599/g.21177 Transcript_10599/m.21177 type:complete len:412 (-) Transcript_10599:79-1314(-)|eukprot:CAMPEP_0113371794 /NCGR_PEP_ID=MMETSP0013_2-20120614/197_1 /TAXON_ID=2843 ORGANISM="Skeletonema costatum, Strain 1716" /NCGR_SAMPLE_ID=MMETSP0013_2 /ASSEMBLY_ACC=CAM_ASM_000158 /LENGTH=411 /DNA_ID=CAMNT_0000253655 /DNA_START=16 /DNA_END=1254 /DNA_ORIENTATION=+ /assembly_acc=CAM_ASM_000158
MVLKQRRGKKAPAANAPAKAAAPTDKSKESNNIDGVDAEKKDHFNPVIIVALFYTLACGLLFFYYNKYGPSMFLGKGWKDYKWSPYKWRQFIDDNERTILIIGGPHRSGTTVVWEGIKTHPDIVGFGSRFDTGVDYSEGVLMQDVYPRFGVGYEFTNFDKSDAKQSSRSTREDGIGRYALVEDVHWTAENKKDLELQDPTSLSRLLNRFGPHWDQNKKFGKNGLMKAKVWVEKSPQNAVLATFLEGLYNMPVNEDGTVDLGNAKKPKRSATKFIYVTRHPIANIYGTDKFVRDAMGGNINFEILLKNYIALHKYMKMDEKVLESPVMWVQLEDFTTNPNKVLTQVFQFLNVSSDEADVQQVLGIMPDISAKPNDKYFKIWCEEGIAKNGHLIQKYAEELNALDLGYDLEIC